MTILTKLIPIAVLCWTGAAWLCADEPIEVEPPTEVTDQPAAEPAPGPAEQPAAEPAKEAAADGNAGQTDLDEATKMKIAAENFNDLSRVIEFCESALKKGLDEPSALFARELIVSTRLQRANRICREIFDRSPPNPNWAQLARAALVDLELAIKYRDDVAEAHLLIGRIQSLPGANRKRARSSLDKAIKFADDDLATKALALTPRGEITEDDKQKLADFDEALRLQPDLTDTLRARGIYYMGKNDFKRALADFEQAAKLEPDHAKTHEALALGLMLQGDVEKARVSLDRAIELAPDEPSAYAYRARLHLAEDNTKQALVDINRAIEIVAGNLSWRLLRSQIHNAAGDVEAALNDVDRVLTVDAKQINAVRLRAAILATAGRMEEAIAGLKRGIEAVPDDSELLLNLAAMYASNKQTQEALDIYEQLLKRDVAHWIVYRSRGDLLLSQGRQSEAIADYERALKLESENSGILNNLAWVLATSTHDDLRDGKRSVKLATEACEVSEYKEAHILSTLAAAYAESGDFETAIKWSTKAVELGDEEVRKQLAAELESYRAKKPWRETQGGDEKEEEEGEKE